MPSNHMAEHVKNNTERKKMGLAASQARLLTITARKADCEFQSMKLSHEKIALSRDMERISDEYQAAMNKTKLVYDYYGNGTSQMNLSYGLLMTPSVYNDYYPKLLTDNKNRVVLSAAYSAAAKAAGIPQEGYNGTPSSAVRNAFVEALRDNRTISAATAANIESVSYNNAIGLGATFSASVATQDITYDDFLEMIKAYSLDTSDYGLETLFTPQGDCAYPNESYLSRGDEEENPGPSDDAFRITVGKGIDTNRDNIISTISLYDLLKNDPDHQYTLSLETGEGATLPVGETAFMQQWLVGSENSKSFLNWMVDQFSAILGGVTENDLALQYAYNQVYDLIYPNEDIQEAAAILQSNDPPYNCCKEDDRGEMTARITDNGDLSMYRESFNVIGTYVINNYRTEVSDQVRNKAKDYIGGVYSATESGRTSMWDASRGRRECMAINLNNIAKVFFTAFQEYKQGIDNSPYSYNKGRISNCVFYEPKNDDIFTVTANTDVTDGTENLNPGFYDTLFNRICTSGWTENDNITDIEYMQELLKNGAVYISSMSNDGNYYQNSYSTDTYISEIPDAEGIARAEAKYNSEKSRIENKENTIDVKMKNLDTEISSLTTEYDTMKSVINKTIEKSFKRYEA